MDPNAALERIRAILTRWFSGDIPAEDAEDTLNELTGLVEGLDGWLSRGGFPPAAWSGGGQRPTTGAVPPSWMSITGVMLAEPNLRLLRRVDELGIAHDDLDAVRRVWQQMSDN